MTREDRIGWVVLGIIITALALDFALGLMGR